MLQRCVKGINSVYNSANYPLKVNHLKLLEETRANKFRIFWPDFVQFPLLFLRKFFKHLIIGLNIHYVFIYYLFCSNSLLLTQGKLFCEFVSLKCDLVHDIIHRTSYLQK